MHEVLDCKQVFGCFFLNSKLGLFRGEILPCLVPKKKRHRFVQRMFLEKIPLNKKRSGEKEKNPPHPSQEQLLGRRRKKRENSTLTFRNNQTSPLSHVNQETTPHWKGPALEKKHLSIPFPKGQEEKSLWNGCGITPPFPSPPIKKSPFEKEKKRKLPTLCSFHKTPHITSNFINSIYFYSWPLIFTQTSIPQKNPFKKGKKFNSSTSFQKYSL